MYKVGDYVQIRKDLENREYVNSKGESLYCVELMLNYRGQIVQIEKVIEAHKHFFISDLIIPTTYHLSIDDGWSWSDEMLLPVANSIKILLEERKIGN